MSEETRIPNINKEPIFEGPVDVDSLTGKIEGGKWFTLRGNFNFGGKSCNIAFSDWGGNVKDALKAIGDTKPFVTELGFWEETDLGTGEGEYKNITSDLFPKTT